MTFRDAVAGAAIAVMSGVVIACGGASSTAPAVRSAGVCGGQTGVSTASSGSYVVVLVATTQVSPEVASPSASPSPSAAPPVVLSGTVAAVSGPGATHLELHICNRATGAVVSGLHPDVTVRNVSAGKAAVPLPVAVLQDAGQGDNGTASGNNVLLEGEQTYAVDVKIDATDSVSLTYSVPVVGPKPSPPPACLDNHQMCDSAS